MALSEILYAYSSAAANNGSAFGGISVNTKWYNTTLGLTMLFGRYFMIIPPLAIAGSLSRKKMIPPSLGTFPVTTPLFTALLVGVILIVGALTFFPGAQPRADCRALPDAERTGLLMTTHAPAKNTLNLGSGRSSGEPFWDSFRKLHPRTMASNPVMFVVEIGSVLTTWRLMQDALTGGTDLGFELQITLWLWLTVLFANFAEAMAEGRGKAQADTLRKTRTETVANRLTGADREEKVPAASLRKGDVVIVHPGEFIPGDGEIIEGVASVDESAITGESAPVIRESGGDRSAVTGGTRVLSDWIKVRITSDPGHTFMDRMIALVEGAERQKTPNEIALNILLAGLTIVFLIAVVTLQPFAVYSGAPQSLFVLISLLVCLIPTTIGGLLSAIGIAGHGRLVQHNVLAMSGRSVEAAGDVHTLLLDKTGTITLGNRQATEFVPLRASPRRSGRRRPTRIAGGRNARRAIYRRPGEREVCDPRARAG